MIEQLVHHNEWDLSRWTYHQLRTIAEELMIKIDYHQDRVLNHHYSSGIHINSNAKLTHDLLPALDKIRVYAYNEMSADIARDVLPMFYD